LTGNSKDKYGTGYDEMGFFVEPTVGGIIFLTIRDGVLLDLLLDAWDEVFYASI
jgi:hypothetical protein